MKLALLILPLTMLATTPHAQQVKHRIGFVDVQQVVAVLPDSARYLALFKKVDADMSAKQKKLQQLAARANSSGKAADRQALQKTQQAFLSTQQSYHQRLIKEFEPLAVKINTAVASVAKRKGFSVVMDWHMAVQSKLVVYAGKATNLTPEVISALKK